MLRAAADHEGTALVEIYQNCNIFNDGAFEPLKEPETRDERTIRLEHGEPIRFGADGKHGVVRARPTAPCSIVDVAEVGDGRAAGPRRACRRPVGRLRAVASGGHVSLAHTPIGVFRDVQRPTYDALMADQIAEATETSGAGDLQSLIAGNDTWTIA